jgi:hypothetical protein
MPHLYVDLDNNKLIAGSASTQIAPTPSFYQGDKPMLELELITRTTGVMAQYTSAASAVNVRIGALGSSSVASVLTLSVVTLSATAAATVGITSPVTATGTVTMLGSITATATVNVNSPSVITITPSVTTFASAQAVAYLGPQAIEPVLKYSLSPAYDRYLDVIEAGTPYDSSTGVYADVTSASQEFRDLLRLNVPLEYVTGPSVTHFMIFRAGITSVTLSQLYLRSSTNTSGSVFDSAHEFLTPSGTWFTATSVTDLSQINLKNSSYSVASRSAGYNVSINSVSSNGNTLFYGLEGGVGGANGAWFTNTHTGSYGYAALVLQSGQVSSALTAAYPYTINGISVSTLGINIGPVYAEAQGSGISVYRGSDLLLYTGNALIEIRTAASVSCQQSYDKNLWILPKASTSLYSGEDISLEFETMPDGKAQISGGSLAITNYQHRPLEALPKTGLVTVYPSKAYPNRRVQTIEISSCGSQYITAPSIMISEPENENGVLAKATAEINNGKLSGITITNPGTGYSEAPDVFVMPPVSQMKYGASRNVTSVLTVIGRRLELAMASGTTISQNSWAVLNGLGNANGLAYVVSVATGGSQTTLKFPYNLGSVTSVGTATLTPLIPYARMTGAVISGTDSNFAVGSTVPVTFSTPSCSDTDAVANFTVLNSGQIALSSIATAGSATTFSVVTLSAYKKITGITVTCAGAGYWEVAPSITIDNASYVPTAPGATPASISAILSGNGEISLTVACAGYGYTSAPTITIDAPNAGNGVRLVSVSTPGVGYSDGTFICSVSSAPTGGTTALVNFVKSGTSQSFAIVNPGRGYTSIPSVTVPKPDLGGQVSAFTVTCKGAGYLVAPAITLTGGGGSGAAAEATIDSGSITTISITTGGTGYTSAPAVAIDSAPSSVYYKKQIDLSVSSVTTLLAGNSSASAYLQIEEKSGTDTTVLAQVPITIQARIS